MAEDQQKLLLTVDANVELFKSGLRVAERDLGTFERRANEATANVETGFGRMQRSGVAALGALSGAIASIGVVGFATLGRQVLQFADDLATAADQASISVERYQTLREGLRALELSTEQTDKVLKNLSATLGEVQGGTAAAGVVEALDRMGITSRILNGEIETTDQLLDAIAAASARYSTEAQFTADVVALLGRKVGVDLAAALRDGGAALKASEQAFREAGAVISNDYLTALADVNEAIDSLSERTRNNFVVTTGAALQSARAIRDAYRELGGISNTGLEQIVARGGQLFEDRQAEAALTRTSDILGRGSGTTGFQLSRPARPALPAASGRPAAAPSRGIRGAANRSIARPGAGLSPAELREANAAGPGILEGTGALTDAERLRDTFLEIRDLSGEIANAKIIDPQAERLSESITQNLAQGIVFGRNIGDALVNSFKAAAAEALASGLFALFRSLGSGDTLGNALRAGVAAFGGARAMGGPVSPGSAYLVGERGPELIVPQVPGRVLTGGQIAAMGGRQSVDVNVTPSPLFEVAVAVTAQQAGAQAAQGVVRRASRGRITGSMGA